MPSGRSRSGKPSAAVSAPSNGGVLEQTGTQFEERPCAKLPSGCRGNVRVVEFEKLAFDAALRALDKQASVLDELRARCAVLVAASALAASFLGREAFADPPWLLAVIALGAFVVSVGSSVYILVPRSGRFVFSLSGPGVYEGLYSIKHDLAEVHRRLAYDLLAFWDANDAELQPMFHSSASAQGRLSSRFSRSSRW